MRGNKLMLLWEQFLPRNSVYLELYQQLLFKKRCTPKIPHISFKFLSELFANLFIYGAIKPSKLNSIIQDIHSNKSKNSSKLITRYPKRKSMSTSRDRPVRLRDSKVFSSRMRLASPSDNQSSRQGRGGGERGPGT